MIRRATRRRSRFRVDGVRAHVLRTQRDAERAVQRAEVFSFGVEVRFRRAARARSFFGERAHASNTFARLGLDAVAHVRPRLGDDVRQRVAQTHTEREEEIAREGFLVFFVRVVVLGRRSRSRREVVRAFGEARREVHHDARFFRIGRPVAFRVFSAAAREERDHRRDRLGRALDGDLPELAVVEVVAGDQVKLRVTSLRMTHLQTRQFKPKPRVVLFFGDS